MNPAARSLCALALSLAAPMPASAQIAPTTPALLDAEAVLPRLREGGMVILMRHQRAAMEGHWDDFTRPWNDCSAQRNLSAGGYAGAMETGNALRILSVEVAQVQASPMCRTMETARLLFGRAQPSEALAHITDVRGRSAELAGTQLAQLADTLAGSPGENAVLITHGGNVLAAYGILLSEGDMLVLEHRGDHAVPIARATATDFDLLANTELVRLAQDR